MNNFIKRTLTGIIFVGILLGGILGNYCTFAILFTILTGLALWEFYGLMPEKSDEVFLYDAEPFTHRVICTFFGMYLFWACFMVATGLGTVQYFIPYVLFLMYVFIHELYTKPDNAIRNWALSLLGQVYCAAPLSLLNFIALYPGVKIYEPFYLKVFVLAIFIFIWLNDTGAFLVGSKFGRHKLFERISPKKTWEGFWGGLVIVLLASLVFAHYSPLWYIRWWEWMGLAAVIAIFGTWGDLTESLLKRTLGVKDSGNILPGHGGILDRIDSVLMAIPAAYCYIELVIQS